MKSDDLDRVLSEEPELVPSSGFVSSVMDAVRAEAMAPPLAFPWRRAWPLAAALAAALVWLAILLARPDTSGSGLDLYGWLAAIAPMGTGWVAAGLAMSALATAMSFRFIRLR